MFFLLMYAAIGLHGVLTFILGMLAVVVLIAVIIFLYIVNENERARSHREELERTQAKKLEEFVVVDHTGSKVSSEGRSGANSSKNPTGKDHQ